MKCPFCHNETKVIDSRYIADSNVIRRRRGCDECSKRFTTYERIEYLDINVIKREGKKEPFDRNKILTGIKRACEKRPITEYQIETMVSEIEMAIRNEDSLDIPSHKIGDLIIEKLIKIDPVAYIRFASVYYDFDDLKAFDGALKKLKRKVKN